MHFGRKVNYIDPLQVEMHEHAFYLQHVHPGDIIFDVGANVGELTLLFSHFAGSKGQIHAFEPTPSTFQRLAATVRNFNRNNVKINNVAVNDKSGFVTFNVYEEAYASWNTMATRPLENYGVNIDAPNAIQVAAVTIDEYCYNENIKEISFLKIDVE